MKGMMVKGGGNARARFARYPEHAQIFLRVELQQLTAAKRQGQTHKSKNI
jgi:hypothetical protein